MNETYYQSSKIDTQFTKKDFVLNDVKDTLTLNNVEFPNL